MLNSYTCTKLHTQKKKKKDFDITFNHSSPQDPCLKLSDRLELPVRAEVIYIITKTHLTQ